MLAQTFPIAQNLPYTQNFGTNSFNSFPVGVQGWRGIDGSAVTTQALAEASSPTSNGTIATAIAATSIGQTYGYCQGGASCGNGRLYIQSSDNNTTGLNQFCIAIKMGINSSLSIAYTVEVINNGVSASQGRVLQYRDSSGSSWTTVSGSAVLYTPGTTTNRGDADLAGDVDTFRYSLNGLNPNTTYYFRWAHWRSSGTTTGVGTAYDNISFTAGCAPPNTQASAFSIVSSTPTAATGRLTRGNGDSVLIVLKAGSAVNSNPLAGVFYNANNSFGSGTQIGVGNFVVAKTTDTAFSISNLTQNTTYFYALYEYKSSGLCYLYPPATGSFTTPCAVPSAQASFSSFSAAIVDATLQFNAGTGGTGRMILLNTTNSFTTPSDGFNPTANANYTSGERVVYANSGNAVTITNLTANTKYYCRLYEYNCSGAQRKYNLTTVADSFTTNSSISSESDVIAIAGSEASTISTLVNHSAPLNINKGIQVWSFTIRDGGPDIIDYDTLPTIIQSLRFIQSTGNAVNDWADAIETVALFRDTVLVATGTVSSTQILFSGNPLISVGDNKSVNLTMRLSLQTSVNNSSSNLDNDDFGFSLSSANIVLAAGSSQKNPALAALVSANDSNRIGVVATKFKITQQPINTGKDVVMNRNIIVAAMDTFDNIDLDFIQPVLLRSSGALNNGRIVDTAEAGIAIFSNIIHNQISDSVVGIISKMDSVSWRILTNRFKITNTTTFSSGDLVLIGYDNNVSAGNKLMLMNFVDILPGTKFQLINACYDLLNASNIRSNRWYDADGTGALTDSVYSHEFTWYGENKINSGSVLCISVPSSGSNYIVLINGNDSSSKFEVVEKGKGVGSPNISTSSPDPIFIGQGNWTFHNTHAQFAGKLLFGLMSGGVWFQFSDNLSGVTGGEKKSRIHPHTECLNIQGKTTSGNAFAYYNGTRNGTKRSILGSIIDPSKWVQGTGTSGDDIAMPMPCNNVFTVTSKWADTNFWHGSADDNWFNCANWENFAVPDSIVNIVIKDTAANSADIENTNAHAAKYNSVALCKNITIDSNKALIINDNLDVLKIYGNIHLRNGSSLNLQSSSGGVIHLRGNWVNESTIDNISELNSSIVLFDTLTQAIQSNIPIGETIFGLELNKSFQKSLTLNSALNTTNIVFTNGIIQARNYMLSTSGTISGYQMPNITGDYSNNNYIVGKLRRAIPANGDYFFPIGDSINGEGYNPISLEILSGTGNATGEFIPGDPGSCNMPSPILFNCGSSINYMVKYDDMTGEGKWNFTGATFNYNVKAYPNKLNINTHPNEHAPPSFSATYRLLKSPSGTNDWRPYVLAGDSCFVSSNYFLLEGKGYTGFSQFAPGGGSGNSTALPVEIIDFSGYLYGPSIAALSWITASERNNDYFSLLKSEDGRLFEEVARISGSGNSNRVVSYGHKVSIEKSTYFKLRQVDFDRTYTDSKIIFIPVRNTLEAAYFIDGQQIKVETSELLELQLFNLAGEKLMHTRKSTLDISMLPSNIYLLSIMKNNGKIEHVKVIK